MSSSSNWPGHASCYPRSCTPGLKLPRLLLLLAFFILCASTAASVQAEATGADRQPEYSGHVRNSFYLPVRDGTRLAVSTYRPAVDGKAVSEPLPVIFLFTPYRARYYTPEGTIAEVGLSERLGLKGLTDYGYVVAVADVRGKGASFGHRRGFQDRTEAQDGYDIIEWLARQPWSSGKVGMTGCSYLGGSTMQVATTAPPALKAVFAGATDFDKYAFVRRGGITAQFNTRPDEPPEVDLQSVPVDEDSDGSLLAAAVAEHADNTPMAGLWYGMPYRDSISAFTDTAFWEEVGPYTYLPELEKSGIAFYLWGNWSDEPTEQVMLAAVNLPQARMLIGPGSHCQPSPEFDFAGELRRYFDFHLKGVDNGMDQQARYTWRLQNVPAEEGWIRSNDLPGAGVSRQEFYLGSGGSLDSRAVGEPGEMTFTTRYDLDNDDYFSFWPEPQDAFGLVYTGPALEHDLALVGFPMVNLVISLDQPDANIFTYIEDVAPDGLVTVVSFGRLASSHRAVSEPPYNNLQRPWHSGISTTIQPMIPGQTTELSFSLLPNAWVFKAGHRLRFTVTGADPRQRYLDSFDQENPPHITVRVGGKDTSRISVPLVPPDQLIAKEKQDRAIGSNVDLITETKISTHHGKVKT
ncbi:MAG TPA: CocE/NonD family hydrolase [Xanthomonadales bacterium]|nr:CocE/NonD family hydrolase [Xanthomonadales bacterium]